jgi:hypothetical protein
VRNYIIYYIAALAESKVAFIQNSLKIRSPNSSVGTNPSSVKLLGAILLSRTCVPKFISTIYTGHSHPYEHCVVEIGCKWDIVKGTYKAGVSYAIAYQVNSNSLSSFNTIPTHIPLHSLSRARFRSWDRHTNISIPSPCHTIPYHRSVDRPTPSRHYLKARSPWLRPTLSHGGRREGLISLSSLSETQERSIADKSAYVSIDQPNTL